MPQDGVPSEAFLEALMAAAETTMPSDPMPSDPMSPEPDASLEPAQLATPFGREGQVEVAVRRYRDSGEAPILKRNSTVLFPFDESQPTVRCSPLRACDIELQAGEVITGVALGDTERWITNPLESGDVNRPIPHVLVKPTDYDLATNLVIATNRRTYHIGLVSPTIDALENGELAYHRHVTFYYPEEMVQQWATRDELRRRKVEQEQQQRTAQKRPAGFAQPKASDLKSLNFDYGTKHKRRIRWAPTTIFDDGAHVYIQMPENIYSMDLPALLVEAPNGELGVVNYRVQGRWYIVDGVFAKAELVLGVGKHRKRVKIHNDQLLKG
jgi:type IV secretion system protein VirB9